MRLNVDRHQRLTGPRPGLDVVELGKFLDGGLDTVRDFQLNLLRAGTGISRGDDGGLHRELRILQLTQGKKAGDTGNRQ